MIERVISDMKITLEQLSAISVCAGPGSYTGLRIGVATAKGLCYALDKPLMLDNKLTLLAYGAYREFPSLDQYISLLTAREKEYFLAVYNGDFTVKVLPQHISEDQLTHLIDRKGQARIITDAPELVSDNNLQIESDTTIDLSSWAFYSFDKYNYNHFVSLPEAEPFYLKQVYTHK